MDWLIGIGGIVLAVAPFVVVLVARTRRNDWRAAQAYADRLALERKARERAQALADAGEASGVEQAEAPQ